ADMQRRLVSLAVQEPRVQPGQRLGICLRHAAPADSRTRLATLPRMTAIAIALALAAAALHGTWNVLIKVSGDPMETFRRATIIAALVTTPLTAVAWLATGRPALPLGAVGLAAISAALELAYLYLLSAAYRSGELSVVYPIARGSAPLLAVVAGLGLLGERLEPGQLAGVGLLLVGILAVTVSQTGGRATVPALLTGVSIAAYTAIDRVGVRLTTPWLYDWVLITLLATALAVTMSVRSRLQRRPELPSPVTWRQGAVIGV